MSQPVILLDAARAEFDEAYDYLQGQRLGLGEEFAEKVRAVFTRIATTPKLHQVVLKGVRRAVVSKFSYCVYYREEADCIRVLSVFHTSRDPAIWQGRA